MTADVDNFLVHYGVKGMRWGVIRRRETSGKRSSSVKRTPEQEARRAQVQKKVTIGAAVAGGILALSAASYMAYDIHKLKGVKSILSVGETNFAKIKESPAGDRVIQKGAEFTRRSFMSNAAWPNGIRTYAVEGGDSDLIRRYGDKVYKFTANRDVRLAGLDTQMSILKSSYSGTVRKALAKENSGYSLSAKRFVNKLPDEKFSKFTIEALRRTAWDGGESGSVSAKNYADLLKRFGYSAVQDLNLPTSSARILFDTDAFRVG